VNTLAGVVHVDPRPSVQEPSSAPLLAHRAGNGFPSDHAVAARLRGSDRERAATTGAARRRIPGT
jgi:hypothetical protein